MRIPTLDGWRGVAILLVLVDHAQYGLLHRYAEPWMQTGQHGVTIFFVLSGFLITSKLLEGPIDLKRFYLRRFFRLMPAAWTYLLVLWILTRLTGIPLTTPVELRSCLLFYRNMTASGHALAGHFWSLSIEEQFYLAWPCLLLLGIRRGRWIAGFGIIACAAFRWRYWDHYNHPWISFQTQVRADALLVGCLLALLLAEPQIRSFIAQSSRLMAIPLLAVLLVCIGRFHWLVPLHECIAIAGLIAYSMLHPVKVLSWPPLAWLGTISYSVYLWHELFMSNLLLLFVMPFIVLVSYYWIEQPSIRLGYRLVGRVTKADNVAGPSARWNKNARGSSSAERLPAD